MILTLPLIAWIFAFLYSFAGPKDSPLWARALTVNAILAVLVLLNSHQLTSYPAARKATTQGSWKQILIPYFPAFFILIVIIASLLKGMALKSNAGLWHLDFRSVAFIFLIPLTEELVFRSGLSNILSRILNPLWGSYFSVLLFSWFHSLPDLQNNLGGYTGLTVGPLLLGGFNECLKRYSGNLLPPLFLHMTCNASGYLFMYGNGGYFAPFRVLYQ